VKPYYDDGKGIVIYHGDCRDVLPTLGAVDLVLTDPPYGIALEEHGRNGYNWTITGDEDQGVGIEVLGLVAGLPVIVFASPKKPWPGEWRQYLCWDKGPAVGGGGDRETCWKFDWELIQVARTPALAGKRESSVLRYWIGQRDYALHPNQKPVALLSYLINKAAKPSWTVLDPFMGSGSTLVAAKAMGRRGVGIETDEGYCEIAAKRLAQGVLFGTAGAA
jgi:DNA modification methylase